MVKVFRVFLAVLGVGLMLNALLLAVVSNFNAGMVFTVIVGALLLGWGVYFNRITAVSGLYRLIKYLIYAGLAVMLLAIMLIGAYGQTDTVNFQEDAVVVLGAGIKGQQVSLTLQHRLDTAIKYIKNNPDALVVVSGAKGFQEDITEALAMERYLVAKGIPLSQIIKEEKATSTYENFVYSKELLDQRLGKPYKAAFITNGFHIFRASRLAHIAGLDAAHYHAKTEWYTLSVSYLREFLAMLKFCILQR